METERWMIVGSWSVTGIGGIGIYRYNEKTGEVSLEKIVREDIVAGFMKAYPEKDLLYVVDEQVDNPDCGSEPGTGGRVFAFRLDRNTGELEEINHQSSLGPLPDYLVDDGTGNGIIAANHGTTGAVTSVERDVNGRYFLKREYNQSPIVHYPVLRDGALGEPDAVIVPGAADDMYSCMHSANLSPDSSFLIACDRNRDRVYRIAYDHEAHQFQMKAVLQLHHGTMKTGACPRYSAFHPRLPLVYVNSEYGDELFVISYEGEGLQLVHTADTTPPGCEFGSFMPSDLVVTPDGKYLYMLYRKSQMICTFAIDGNGIPIMVQTLPLPGEDPRGLRLSPDNRFILVAERKSDDIATIAIGENGMLQCSSICRGQRSPGNIVFMQQL